MRVKEKNEEIENYNKIDALAYCVLFVPHSIGYFIIY